MTKQISDEQFIFDIYKTTPFMFTMLQIAFEEVGRRRDFLLATVTLAQKNNLPLGVAARQVLAVNGIYPDRNPYLP